MRIAALLGSPIAHSLSPAIHNAAFGASGLRWRYQAIEVVPRDLAAAVERLRTDRWVGANVTIPHKEAVLPLLDGLGSSATRTSAVNTIVNKGGRLIGHNTDLQGFLHDLQTHWRVPKTGCALILGAGGAARAVAFGLAQLGLELQVIARSAERARGLAEGVRREHPVRVAVLPWVKESFQKAASHCQLLVNATPLGMAGAEPTSAWPGEVELPSSAFVYDLVYSPYETGLVQRARVSGLWAVSGAGMLLEQAALSFELWTGLRAPRERMRAALAAALGRSQA